MKRTTGRTTLARTGCKPILIQPAAEHRRPSFPNEREFAFSKSRS